MQRVTDTTSEEIVFAWRHRDIYAFEVEAGREPPLPDWVGCLVLADRFRVAPWEVEAHSEWFDRVRVFDEAAKLFREQIEREVKGKYACRN